MFFWLCCLTLFFIFHFSFEADQLKELRPNFFEFH